MVDVESNINRDFTRSYAQETKLYVKYKIDMRRLP